MKEVVAFGRTGREKLIALDYETGVRRGAVEGEADKVNPWPLIAAARAEGRRISLIHNHPGGGPISPKGVAVCLANADAVAGIVSVGGRLRYTVVPASGVPQRALATHLMAIAEKVREHTMTEGQWMKWLRARAKPYQFRFSVMAEEL